MDTTAPQTQPTLAESPSQKIPREDIFFAVLSYFLVTVLATLTSKKGNEFCMFHARQGIMLAICDITWLVVTVIALILVPFLGYLFFFAGAIALFSFHMLGIVHTLKGDMYKLPFIYGTSQLINTAERSGAVKPSSDKAASTSQANSEAIAPRSGAVSPSPDLSGASSPSAERSEAAPSKAPSVAKGQDMVSRAVEELKGDNK